MVDSFESYLLNNQIIFHRFLFLVQKYILDSLYQRNFYLLIYFYKNLLNEKSVFDIKNRNIDIPKDNIIIFLNFFDIFIFHI
jgi:hypothetical protein